MYICLYIYIYIYTDPSCEDNEECIKHNLWFYGHIFKQEDEKQLNGTSHGRSFICFSFIEPISEK